MKLGVIESRILQVPVNIVSAFLLGNARTRGCISRGLRGPSVYMFCKVQLQRETTFRGYEFLLATDFLHWRVFSRRKQSKNAAAARQVGAVEP